MRRVAILIALCALAASPQEKSGKAGKGDKPCCKDGVPKPWSLYNKGIQWEDSLEKAVEKAQKDRRLLQVVHFVGRMDLEGC